MSQSTVSATLKGFVTSEQFLSAYNEGQQSFWGGKAINVDIDVSNVWGFSVFAMERISRLRWFVVSNGGKFRLTNCTPETFERLAIPHFQAMVA